MYGRGLDGMFAGMMLFAAIVGGAIVAVIAWVVPWLWGFIKPWLHAITA